MTKLFQVENVVLLRKKCVSGATCMKWTEKGKYDKGSYVDNFGTGDHNFCRFSLISLNSVAL